MAQQAEAWEQQAAGTIFLCGADMEPTAIRQRYPGARFVARARWEPDNWPSWYPVATAKPAEIWGILLDHATRRAGRPVTVETDDGRSITANVATDAATVGDLAEVLANARYWELIPAFVRQLQSATGQPMVEATEG